MPPEDVIGTLHQQTAEVDIAGLGDTELRVSFSGLTPFRPQAEIATHIATSLETFFASQSQDIGQRREMAHSIDLEKRLCLAIFRLDQLLDGPVVLFDLRRHIGNLMEHRCERPGKSRRQRGQASLGEAERGRRWQPISAGLC
jgi:hypothetical protein